MILGVQVVLSLGIFTCIWQWGKQQAVENEVLKDQLEKSALIMTRQQEKTRLIGEKIDSLHNRILTSKEQLESTFDAISDGICVLDKDLTIQRVNRAYASLVNMPLRDLLGRKCYHVFWHTKGACENCPANSTFESGLASPHQAMAKPENDKTFHYEMSSYPVKDNRGQVFNVIESIRDVTEQRLLTEQLIRSEKLSTIGIMTAGIAHEMNNPLSGISGNAANMLQMPEKYGINDKGVLRIRSMLEASERATLIMKSLLDLSRPQERQFIFTDLGNIISNALTRIHLPGYNSIRKEIKVEKAIPPIQCDAVKIEQVFINIFTNAYYAIQEKQKTVQNHIGSIVISIERSGSNVLVMVEDNGAGVPADKMKHIFDPFYTTRPPGQGTGLGLSISHKIISEHDGKIWAQNGKEGAQIFIQLPFPRTGTGIYRPA
jgi:PAS domain S-box-containing protein